MSPTAGDEPSHYVQANCESLLPHVKSLTWRNCEFPIIRNIQVETRQRRDFGPGKSEVHIKTPSNQSFQTAYLDKE